MEDLLIDVARRATAYRESIETDPIRPKPDHDLTELVGPFPEHGSDPEQVIKLIDEVVAPATMGGFEVLNDVLLNQVLVSFGDPGETRRVIETVCAEGVMFAGPTVWQGRTAMRISVSGYATGEDDVERSVDALVRAARG